MARAMENQAALLLRGLGNRILALVTASQIASASAISFFCRLTKGTKNRDVRCYIGETGISLMTCSKLPPTAVSAAFKFSSTCLCALDDGRAVKSRGRIEGGLGTKNSELSATIMCGMRTHAAPKSISASA